MFAAADDADADRFMANSPAVAAGARESARGPVVPHGAP